MNVNGACNMAVALLQVVVWQKAKAADYRSALLATLGSATLANLLPCHHCQEQAEVCSSPASGLFHQGYFINAPK